MRSFFTCLVGLAASLMTLPALADAPAAECKLDLMCIVLSDGLHQCDKVEDIDTSISDTGVFSFERQTVATSAQRGVSEDEGWTFLSDPDDFDIVYRILLVELSTPDRALGIVQLLYDDEVRGEYSGRCSVMQ